jgi:hypothetical protein
VVAASMSSDGHPQPSQPTVRLDRLSRLTDLQTVQTAQTDTRPVQAEGVRLTPWSPGAPWLNTIPHRPPGQERGSWVMARYRGRPEKLAVVLACQEAWEAVCVMAREPSVYARRRGVNR